jgi:hypothetical protein
MTVLFGVLLASAYLLFLNLTGYWGLFFGFLFVLSIFMLLVDAFTIPVFKEKFFSGILKRKKKEEISGDTSSIVLKRANYKCQNCGKPGRRIYHMDRDKSNNDIHNLLCLCDKCVAKVKNNAISSDSIYFMRLREKHERKKRV